MQDNKPTVKQDIFLTVVEKNTIGNLPVQFQEYVTAKFKTQICKYQAIDLESKVSALVMKTLVEAGVKDAGDNQVVTFLRSTLFEDLKKPQFARLTFEEIELAFSKGVRQEYGVYMGVNIQTMHTWLRAYLNSKGRELAFKEFYLKVGEMEHGSTDRNSKPNPEGIKKVLEVLKPFAESSKVTYVKKEKKFAEKSPRDIFIQECFTEFENLYKDKKNHFKPAKLTDSKEQGLVVNMDLVGKFIDIDGKPIDQVTFTQMKVS